MLSKNTFAGSFALLAAPIVVITATLAQPRLSDGAAKQVAALTDHRSAAIAGMALSMIAVVLLIAGAVWLALALAQRAPRLAVAGGVLGVLGALVVLFEDSAAAAPSIVSGLDRPQATAVIDRIHKAPPSRRSIRRRPPVSSALFCSGIAAVKAGAPRWTAAAIAVGALGEAAGFATRHEGAPDHRRRLHVRRPATSRAHARRVPWAPPGCPDRRGRGGFLSPRRRHARSGVGPSGAWLRAARRQ